MFELFRGLFAPPRHLILLVISAWLGLALAEKRTGRFGISREHLNNLVFYGLLAYVFGGRLAFAAAHSSVFLKSPLSLISLNPDLFDPSGAALAAILAGLIYGRRQKLPFWNALDSLTLFFATLAIGISLADFAAGTAFGSPTTLPWGIELWNATRHPTQIYSLLASLLTLGLLWFNRRTRHPGIYFLAFTALTAAWRLFIEAFRGDSVVVFGSLREAQLIAWLILGVSFLLMDVILETPKRSSKD